MSGQAPTYPVGTIAKLLLLTERRVQQLTKEGVIPKAYRGRYELAPAVQGYIKYLNDRSRGSEEDVANYERERARKTRAQADEAEERVRLMRGQSHNAEAVAFFMGKAIAGSRARILSIPNATAAAVAEVSDPESCRKILDAACREAAMELSDYDPASVVGKTRHDLSQNIESEKETNGIEE
jgi:phage terminase Nu1 subunit (DNA packaging protein)